ncbi:MAG: hypothetical protein QOG12_1426 [Verrucomicrobiota bacterium]|jgi:hypothetical protein
MTRMEEKGWTGVVVIFAFCLPIRDIRVIRG